MIDSYGIVLCYLRKDTVFFWGFTFEWDFVILSLEIPIQLFFFLFLFPKFSCFMFSVMLLAAVISLFWFYFIKSSTIHIYPFTLSSVVVSHFFFSIYIYIYMYIYIYIYIYIRKLDGNYTRAILNKSGRQHPTRLQLYGHLPPITKTIQVRRIRHVGHCWRSKDELISDVLQWTPHIWPCKNRTTCSNLHTATMWGYRM